MEKTQSEKDLEKSLQETLELIGWAEKECDIGLGMSEGILEDPLRQKYFNRALDQASPEQRRALEQLALLRRQEANLRMELGRVRDLENDKHEKSNAIHLALTRTASIIGPLIEAMLAISKNVMDEQKEAVGSYFKLRAQIYRMKRDALLKENFTREEALKLILGEGQKDPFVELLHLQKEMLDACPFALKR